jgi:hypothetical protein
VEIGCLVRFALLDRLLVGTQRIIGDVELVERQQTNDVDKTRQRAHCIGAAAEAEKKDAIVVLIMLDKECVGTENFVVEAVSGSELKHALGVLADPRPCIDLTHRADAGVVIDALLVVLLHNAKQLEDIRRVADHLISRSVFPWQRAPQKRAYTGETYN